MIGLRTPLVLTDAEDRAEFKRAMRTSLESIAVFSIDAFADGVVAHREGKKFHENPRGTEPTLSRLSWSFGWNERALRQR